MKRIAILGSTGSIGRNTLEVIRHFPEKFKVVALSTNSNIGLMDKQIKEFHPRFVAVSDISRAGSFKFSSSRKIKLFTGQNGLAALVQEKEIDEVVLAISGSSALLPLLKAIQSNKQIALANKEAIVMAGPLIMRQAQNTKAKIIPVDSEQSAIWQCLQAQNFKDLKNIYLTASGGPLLKASTKELRNISINRVLKHPRWSMGRKITVDSANLMNKGLELLETMFLFGLPLDKIKILIHPQAIIHSMVEFVDGVVLAQLSATDMRIPIQYALTYPDRLSNSLPCINFAKLRELNFQSPDFNKFPCLGLAYRAAKEKGTFPAVLNASNEVCVDAFLHKGLNFATIPKVISKVFDIHRNIRNPALEDILEADRWARNQASAIIKRLR